jgi:PAS domain S-box-containing protein
MRILPYRTIDNVIEGAVLTFLDVTEMRLAEAAHRELEQKYRTLHEGSPDARVDAEVDAQGRDLGFVDCNQAALDLLGMTRAQLLASTNASLSPEQQPDGRPSREKIGELIARCLSRGNLRFEWVFTRASGSALPVEITTVVYRERARTFLHSVWRDLTGRAHAAGEAVIDDQGGKRDE